MKRKRYEAYKESGIEWIGEIPAHWMKEKIKFLFSEKKKESNPNLRSGAISFGKVIYKDDEKVPFETKKSYQVVNKGEFLINPLNLNYDLKSLRIALSEIDVVVSQGYIVLQLKKEDASRIYLSYLLHIFDILFMKSLGAGVRQTISFNDLANCFLPLPPKQEQIQIADYLDKKTAQIDKAITLKERLIALLKEQRQILINRAVTQGLDPDVPMKESGVEWIGKIPAHWEVRKLKFVIKNKLKYGANESGIPYDEKLPRYVRITDFSDSGKLSEANKLSLPWEIGKEYLLNDGDILFARSGATVGKTYQFKKSMSKEKYYAFAGYLIKAEPNENIVLSDYLYLFTNSDLFEKWKQHIFNKATIENIGADKYSELLITLPPLNVQKDILNKYNIKKEKIDKAIDLQEKQIDKLKAYKASLIDAVVTGKVKIVDSVYSK